MNKSECECGSAVKSIKSTFNVPWSYWFCVLAFLAMAGVGVSLTFSQDEDDRRTGLAGSIVFLTIGVGGLMWPILRRRETNGIQTAVVHIFDLHCDALLFAVSRAKQLITILGAMFLCLGIITMILVADDSSTQVKGFVALVFYAVVCGMGLKLLCGPLKGIYLVPSGIIWNPMFQSPCFIPWSIISEAALFLKKESYVSKPTLCFGLKVSDPFLVQASKLTSKRFRQSRARRGWDLYFFDETIVAPLATVAQAVQYCLQHPEARSEIAAAGFLARIEKIEASAGQQVY